jgi:hypothetical protein
LNRKFAHSIWAAIPVLLFPLAAAGQAAPAGGTTPADQTTEHIYKYEASVGFGYTSINQVNQSRGGLEGVEFYAARDWGRFFAVLIDGGYYNTSLQTNPGKPVVDMGFAGPEIHANLYGPLSGYVRGLLGAEHTGGEGAYPDVSFAGGVGLGMNYAINPRFSLRAGGDDIFSSFVLDPQKLGYSPHKRANARAQLGVVFKF